MAGRLDQDRILELLGSGLAPGIVATTVGCEASFISQLMSQEEFAAKVVEKRSASLLAATARDRKADTLEDTLLDRLTEAVQTREIYKPREVLQAYNIVSRAPRRGNPADAGVVINNNVVQLTLPVVVVRNFTKNNEGEVIEVEGQTMQTMPAASLLKHLAGTKGDERGQVYEKIGRFIAPPIEHSVSKG